MGQAATAERVKPAADRREREEPQQEWPEAQQHTGQGGLDVNVASASEPDRVGGA